MPISTCPPSAITVVGLVASTRTPIPGIINSIFDLLLSELRRPKAERKVLAFVAAQSLDRLYILRPMFDQRVLPVLEDIIFKWRLLVADARKVGHTFSQPDLCIAATALHHGLTNEASIYRYDTDAWICVEVS